MIEVFKKQRPGEPPTLDNSRNLAARAVLRPEALRPDEGRPLQAEPAARRRRARRHAHADDDQDIVALVRKLVDLPMKLGVDLEDRRTSPPRRSQLNRDPIRSELDEYEHFGNRRLRTHRRADPGGVPRRPLPDGARRPRADDDRGRRHDHAADDHQHPTGRRGAEGVLRLLAALAVHGPDELARGADAPAAAHRARRRRPHPRARSDRGARRPPDPLRPHVPDRDAGGAEHRPDRLARLDGDRVRVRLHPDAVPGRQGRQGHGRDRLSRRRRGGAVHDRAGVGARRSQDRQVPERHGALPLEPSARRSRRPRRTSSSWTSRRRRSSRSRPP